MAQLTDEQLQNTNSVITNGLEAKTMRHKIENKDLLSQKGALYVGTGNTTSTGAAVTAAINIPDDANGKVLAVSDDETSENGWKFVDTIANAIHSTNADNIKLDETYKTFKLAVLDVVYPIGSIYMSVNNVSPQVFLGGTWERWGNGRVPVGVDIDIGYFATVEQTGGAATVTLTLNQMPKHDHTGRNKIQTTYGAFPDPEKPTRFSEMTKVTAVTTQTAKTEQVKSYEPATKDLGLLVVTQEYGISNGEGNPHNNLQPYITCYMWKRTE